VDRELILLAMAMAVCGPLALAFGVTPTARPLTYSGQAAEAIAWRRLWLPLVPGTVTLAILVGWAIQEPDNSDELLHPAIALVAAPCAILWMRAIARAAWSLLRNQRPLAATSGLLRPRAMIAAKLAQALDSEELEAVRQHEAAHVRHRDPLRIWMAQLAADLQWPWPSAARRLRAWRHALELARDDEARALGVDGVDLAQAIVVAARLGVPGVAGSASLIDDAQQLQKRIARLLEPLTSPARGDSAGARWLLSIGTLLVFALLLGVSHGEALIRLVPGVQH
jgi:hypothetical protein